MYPWESDDKGSNSSDIQFESGILPRIVLLLTQQKLLSEFCQFETGHNDQMMNLINRVFNNRNLANGSFSEHQIQNIINATQERFYKQLVKKINYCRATNFRDKAGSGAQVPAAQGQILTCQFSPHFHQGKYWRLPANFGYPQGTARDIWCHWNISDTEHCPSFVCLKQKNLSSWMNVPVNDLGGRLSTI